MADKIKTMTFLCAALLGMACWGGCHARQPGPKEQALAYYKALHQEDWKAEYPLTAFSPEDKRIYTDADTFARDMHASVDTNAATKAGYDTFTRLSDIMVGEPIMNGDRADVPTSATLPLNGYKVPMNGVAHMIKEDGAWKFDLTAPAQNGVGQALLALLGKPDMEAFRKKYGAKPQ